MNNLINNLRDGMTDVKNMLSEQNFKPFMLPLIILLVSFFALKYINDQASERVQDARNKVEAQKAEINNEQEYKISKATYERLSAKLPPADKKNEWLAQTMTSLPKSLNINGRVGATNMEDSGIFTLSSMAYEFESDYVTLGKFVEGIENYDKFLRISSLTATRMDGTLGKVKVNMILNTVFINEKAPVGGSNKGPGMQ